MTKLLTLICLCFSLVALSQDHVPNQLLIQLEPTAEFKPVLEALNEINGTPIRGWKKISNPLNVYEITFRSGSDLDALLKSMATISEIRLAQKNHYIEDRVYIPNDPSFGNQWHLNNTGQTGGNADADIDAPEAWDITTGGLTAHQDTIVVCIIESNGVDLSHEDLAGNMWRNYQEIPNNGIDDDNNGYIDDFRGWNVQSNNDVIGTGSASHGTRVAGMIGAIGDNNIGVSGVNHTVKMMVVQGQQANNESTVIAAYSYPLEMRKKFNESNGTEGAFVVVTNSSWGDDGGTPADAPLWCAMYDSLGRHGIINIGATTNNNVDVDAVGDLPTTCTSDFLIGVTMTNSNDMRANSGYGAVHVDLAAPGSSVLLSNSNNTYTTSGGTSFAAPCVSGAVALLYAAPCADFISYAKTFPDSAALRIRSLILDQVDVISNLSGEVATGGRLNVNNSIQELVSTCDQNACITPYGLANTASSDTSITLNWNGFNSTAYILKVTEPNGNIYTVNTGAATQYTILDLSPCTYYQINVLGLCGNDTSNLSPTLLVQTDGCCYNPTLQLDDATETTLVLNWNNILNATAYHIRYRPDGSTNWQEVTSGVNAPFTISDLDTCTTYELQIKTICTDSTRGYSESLNFSTTGCGICFEGFYCMPMAANINTNDEWIASITINGFTSTTGDNGGYYYGDVFTNGLKPNLSYPFTFVPGYSGFNFTERFSLWIDLDLNGSFEPSEQLITNLSGVGTQSGLIYMPSFSTQGITRMRIAMNGVNSPTLCADENGSINGEYEDYCIQIGGNASVDNETLNFSIYPNPSTGIINLMGNEVIEQVKVYNHDGQLVYDQQGFNLQKIDLSHLSAGIYIIEIKASGALSRQKLVKQ